MADKSPKGPQSSQGSHSSPDQSSPSQPLRGDEGVSSKLWSKTRDAPYVPAGILGTLAVVGYGIYDFRNRGPVSASVYIMQYRVKAQSVIVGAMTLGVTYSLLKEYVFNKKD